MIPGGWNSYRETRNTQHNPGPVNGALEKKKEINPCEWTSQRKARITRHDPGPVEDGMEEKEMIPCGWKRQRKAINNVQYLATSDRKSLKIIY